MLFIVRFADKPDTQAIRQAFLPAHLAWLDAHQTSVLVGGSLRTESDGSPLHFPNARHGCNCAVY